MGISNKQKMIKCIKMCDGDMEATAASINVVTRKMRKQWGSPPKKATKTVIDNVSKGRTASVDYHIGRAMDKLIRDDELAVDNIPGK